jgi:HEAT repeat protein
LGFVKDKDGRWVEKGQEEGELVIAPLTQVPREKSGQVKDQAQEIKDLAQKIHLFLQGKKDAKYDESQGLIALSSQRPDLFIRVLRAKEPSGNQELKTPIRAGAAFFLGEGGDRSGMAALLEACFFPDDEIRMAAAKALPKLDEPVALRKLTDASLDEKFPWTTRRLAAIALRRYGDKESIDRLLTSLSLELAGGNPRDSRNKLRGSPGGLGSENPLGLPTNIPPPTTADDTILYPALSALKEILGISFDKEEKDFKTWKGWWAENKEKFSFKD